MASRPLFQPLLRAATRKHPKHSHLWFSSRRDLNGNILFHLTQSEVLVHDFQDAHFSTEKCGDVRIDSSSTPITGKIPRNNHDRQPLIAGKLQNTCRKEAFFLYF